jgi:hypothetical protein
MKFLLLTLALILPHSQAFAITPKDKHSLLYDTVMYDTTDYGDNCAQGAGSLPGTVPEPYNRIFTAAGAKHNVEPALIAAIFYAGENGSSWPNPEGPWPTSPAGAVGPFQFLPSTWNGTGDGSNGFKDDGDGDGDTDVQDLDDAAFGAAKYLASNGGTVGSPDGTPGSQPGEGPSIRNAIWHYNHADWYVEIVFGAYQQFLSGGAPSTRIDCGAGLGMTTDGFVFPVKTTKQVITGGSAGPDGRLVWCYDSERNCHHDYNAADIHAPTDTPVVSSLNGTVVAGSLHSGPARLRIMSDPDKDGNVSWLYYTHLKAGSITVSEGERVTAGQVIGLIGTAGDAEGTAPHVHFDISPVQNGFSRPGPDATRFLIDPQPVLVNAFNNLPERDDRI